MCASENSGAVASPEAAVGGAACLVACLSGRVLAHYTAAVWQPRGLAGSPTPALIFLTKPLQEFLAGKFVLTNNPVCEDCCGWACQSLTGPACRAALTD